MMKNISLFLLACATMLVSCGGSNNTNNTSNTDSAAKIKTQQPAIVKLHKWSNDCPNITGLKITADTLYITQDGKDLAYKIDRNKSCEKVEFKKYEWIFAVSKCDAQAADYKQITVMSHLTEIYGEPDQFDDNLCYFDTKEDKQRMFTHACEIDDIQGLKRQYFANYPVSKPMPELVFDTKMFTAYSFKDAITASEIIANAKKISIKGSTVTVNDGTKSVDLEIYPLSDNESVYAEGYDWIFTTKPNGNIPRLQWEVNTGFPDDWNDVLEKDRRANLNINNCGYYDVDFHSWKNLKRKMFINYPTDEQYQNTMEEGVLPDVDPDYDEEEYEVDDEQPDDNPNQARIDMCKDLWNDLKEDQEINPFAQQVEGSAKDNVVKIEGLSYKGATHYEVMFYPLELGRDFKIYVADYNDDENYTVTAYKYGQLGFQEVPLEPVLDKALKGILNAHSGPFHFDGNTFEAYDKGKLISELVFDFDKGEFVKK